MSARPAWRGNRPGARVGARTDRDACRRLRRRRRIAAFRKPTRPWPRSPVLPPAAFEGSGVGDSQRARQIGRRGQPSGPASSPSASRPASGGAAKGRSCLIRKREASGHDVLMRKTFGASFPSPRPTSSASARSPWFHLAAGACIPSLTAWRRNATVVESVDDAARIPRTAKPSRPWRRTKRAFIPQNLRRIRSSF